MTAFLKKIGLADSFQIELPMDKSDFVKTLIQNVDEPGEALSTTSKAYKGTVKNDGFELTRKRKFDRKTTSPLIKGALQQVGGRLIVEVTLDAFIKRLIPYYAVLTAICLFAFGLLLFTIHPGNVRMIVLIFMAIQVVFMFAGPYVRTIRSVRETKYDLERDLHFMMKDKFTSGNE